jgi:superfamily II DNA helicase RecQ
VSDVEALIQAARLNVARSQQAVASAQAARYQQLEHFQRVRQQLADDLALLGRLKVSHERTGIIRG